MKKLLEVSLITFALVVLSSIFVFAAGWAQQGKDWYYLDDSGNSVKNQWVGNYYLGADGKMLTNTTTPDGYQVGADGAYIQNQAASNTKASVPDEFKQGYQYGEYSKFNSYASDNGLGKTPVWIEGSYAEIFPVNLTVNGKDVTVYSAHVVDTNGNKWLVQLESNILTTPDEFYNLVGHNVCIAGLYQGKSRKYNEPAIITKKVYDINTGKTVTSVYGSFAS